MTEVNCPKCDSDRNGHWPTIGRAPEHRRCNDCDHVFPAYPEEGEGE